MDIYLILAGVGFGGFLASLVLGFVRFGGHTSGSVKGSASGHLHTGHVHAGHLHSGHLHSGHGGVGHGHSGSGHSGSGHTGSASSSDARSAGHQGGAVKGQPAVKGSAKSLDQSAHPAALPFYWSLLSPLNIFSLCFGAGIAGIVARAYIQANWVPFVAAAGAIAFSGLIVRPLSDLVLKFEGTPTEGLEATVSAPAIALGPFDSHGLGIIQVELDGQLRQVLGQLDPAEQQKGIQVHKGDQLLLVTVDASQNRCMVSKELA